jgi:hypothetical protein
MIWKIWKKIVIRYGQYGRKESLIVKRYEKYRRNCEKIWKIQKKSKVNSEKMGKIRKKSGWWWWRWWWRWWWQTLVRNVIIEINNVIMKIKWRGRGRYPVKGLVCRK